MPGSRATYGPLVVLFPLAERIAEYKTAMGVSETVSAVGIELSTRILGGDVHLRKVAIASDLDIVRSLHEMRALDGAVGDETSAVAVIHAPRNHDLLDSTDSRVLAIGVGRCPDTEV